MAVRASTTLFPARTLSLVVLLTSRAPDLHIFMHFGLFFASFAASHKSVCYIYLSWSYTYTRPFYTYFPVPFLLSNPQAPTLFHPIAFSFDATWRTTSRRLTATAPAMVTHTGAQHRITEATVTMLVALPAAIIATVSLQPNHTAQRSSVLILVLLEFVF